MNIGFSIYSCMKYTLVSWVLGDAIVTYSTYCFGPLNYYTVNNWVYNTLEEESPFCEVSYASQGHSGK